MANTARAASAATIKGGIQLDQITLIGTFGTDKKRSALVRRTSGRIVKVHMGESVGTSRVVAISRDSVFLRSGSTTKKLEMPKG